MSSISCLQGFGLFKYFADDLSLNAREKQPSPPKSKNLDVSSSFLCGLYERARLMLRLRMFVRDSQGEDRTLTSYAMITVRHTNSLYESNAAAYTVMPTPSR